RRSWTGARMMPKLIIDGDLTLDFRGKIFKVIIEPYNRTIVQILAQLGIGIEPVIHDDRFKVLQWSARNEIFSKHIPRPSHDSRGSVAAALRHVKTGSLRRNADRSLVGSIVTLPILTLHHEPGKETRSIARINPVPVKRSFPTSIDLRIGIIALSRQERKTDE